MSTQEDTQNCVFIGKKPNKNYVFAVQTQAQSHNEIFIKARGKSISHAVDVALIVTHRFLTDWEIKDMQAITEEIKSKETDQIDRVSTLTITIRKNG